MKIRHTIILLVFPALVTSALGQQKNGGKIFPPAAMLGVWGADAAACKGEPIEAENRLEVEREGVGRYVTYYGVRTWQRQGDTYSGRATLAEEGEGKPVPGRYHVALRLLRDGQLEARFDRGKPSTWVRCPPGTYVR